MFPSSLQSPTRQASLDQTPNAPLWLVFALPLTGLIKFDFLGQIYVHEVLLCLLSIPLVLARPYILNQRDVLLIVFALILWLLSQIGTDIVVESEPRDYLRGWAKIIVCILSFLALLCLIQDARRAIAWLVASGVASGFRSFQLFPGELDVGILWKFGLGSAALMVICAPILLRAASDTEFARTRSKLAIVHALMGMFSFFLNARSFASACLLVALFLVLFSPNPRMKGSPRFAVISIVALSLVITALTSFYSWGARSGAFGEEAKFKFELQYGIGGGPLEIVLGGRSEILVSLKAIEESPIIGHGSWAKDIKYSLLLLELRRDHGFESQDELLNPEDAELIPSHSYLFGSWVDAGIFGGLFWILIIFWILSRATMEALRQERTLSLLFVVTAPGLIWNILFSPFGAYQRIDFCGLMAVYCLLCRTRVVLESR